MDEDASSSSDEGEEQKSEIEIKTKPTVTKATTSFLPPINPPKATAVLPTKSKDEEESEYDSEYDDEENSDDEYDEESSNDDSVVVGNQNQHNDKPTQQLSFHIKPNPL